MAEHSRNTDSSSGIAARFSSLVDGGPSHIFPQLIGFVRALWITGKTNEFISFVAWEIMHKVGVFKYIKFNSCIPITPTHNWINNIEAHLKHVLGVNIRRSECINVLYIDKYGHRYVCYATSPCELVCWLTDIRTTVFTFETNILAIFVSDSGAVFVSLNGGLVVRSTDSAKTFSESLKLSHKDSRIWFAHGITETPRHELLLGEYGCVPSKTGFQSVAFLYCSKDNGISWERSDFLVKQGVNKHIHIVKYCHIIKSVLLTDGDNKKQLWIGRMRGSRDYRYIEWRPVTRVHFQTGGYTSIIECSDKIIFGTDYVGGTNFIIHSMDGTHLTKLAIPDPYRRSPVLHMEKIIVECGEVVWAILHESCFRSTKSLLMCSRDGGDTWIKLIEYPGSKYRIDIVSSSSETINEIYITVYASCEGRDDVALATFVIEGTRASCP